MLFAKTGLNCEYDGLSEVILTLSHSSPRARNLFKGGNTVLKF